MNVKRKRGRPATGKSKEPASTIRISTATHSLLKQLAEVRGAKIWALADRILRESTTSKLKADA